MENEQTVNNTETSEQTAPPVEGEVAATEKKKKKRKMSPKTKKRIYNFLWVPLAMLVSGVIRAVVVHMFVVPFNFATSGVAGIAVLIEHATGFSAGYIVLILNLPLMILSFFFIGKRFTVISSISIVISAIGMILMDMYSSYFPTYSSADANPIFAAITAGVLGGVGFAIMIRIGGSTGGSDIIAMLVQKKRPEAKISWLIYGVDAVIIFSSIFVFKGDVSKLAFMTPVLLSLTEEFSRSMIGDIILTGLRTALKYEIITDKPEELSRDIMTKLGRGVTCTDITGMYTHGKHSMLVCIIRKRQLGEFNKILKKYPDTFAYVMDTREVIGKGFSDDNGR